MTENNFFIEKIVFEGHWRQVTMEQINEYIDDFPGKRDFIEFYLSNNGGVFTEGAYFYPNKLYGVPNDYHSIEIASFLHIPLADDNENDECNTYSIEKEKDRRVNYSEEFADFILFHIPFADNEADNTFWIDTQTGEIKYIDFEMMDYNPDNAITVASSFSDFCRRIQGKLRDTR